MSYPRMMRIQQHFDSPTLHDPAVTVREELTKLPLSSQIRQGDTVAITVGSRGIANMALIIKTLAEELKSYGAKPFVVPAMGSHGAGTAEGQRTIIEGYGVTEDYTGAPVKSTMEVVQVGSIEGAIPVYFDKYAYDADHVAIVGRIKPHTEFSGDIESGLHKMMLIGLGNHRGARAYHQAFSHYSFDHIVRTASRVIMEKCNILLGLAIVENHYDETAIIRAVAPEEFLEQEVGLLILAKRWIPRLPFQQVDLLIVDQIGKEISGTGMDTNVIGRKDCPNSPAQEVFPKVTRIYVRDLTEETHGNATGIGIADFTHIRLVDKIDLDATYINCLTVNTPKVGAIPIHYDTDKRILDAALGIIGDVHPEEARVIRILNTLDLKEIMVSEVYKEEIKNRDDLKVIESLRPMMFDEDGNLLHF